jgi:phosphoenolpyruvate carboxylase
VSYSVCIACERMVPLYEKYCESCLKRYPHLKQVEDFWRNYYYTMDAARELAKQEIGARPTRRTRSGLERGIPMAQDKAREQFEEYATREHFNIYRRSDGYVDDYTNMRWTTWKAAFAVREDEISELTNELTKLYEQATEHVKAIVLAREIIKKRMLNP